MKKLTSFILVLVAFNFTTAQDIQYVKAENGLAMRNQPNRGAIRLALLDYGTVLEVVEHTNLQLDVMDNGKKLSGEWVKVRSIDAYDFFEGYVFNGFLTQEKLQKRFKNKYDEFTITIDGLSEKEPEIDKINPNFDGVLFYKLNEGETLAGKTINVKHQKEFRSIQVFQKHENSIVVSDNDSHCDMINWQHYYSSWKPLKTIKSNQKFVAAAIPEKEQSRFIEVDINELKAVVKDDCGESWANAIQDVKTVNDFPVSVKVSKLYLRILMTDMDGNNIEKILIFEVPIENSVNTNSYANR